MSNEFIEKMLPVPKIVPQKIAAKAETLWANLLPPISRAIRPVTNIIPQEAAYAKILIPKID